MSNFFEIIHKRIDEIFFKESIPKSEGTLIRGTLKQWNSVTVIPFKMCGRFTHLP